MLDFILQVRNMNLNGRRLLSNCINDLNFKTASKTYNLSFFFNSSTRFSLKFQIWNIDMFKIQTVRDKSQTGDYQSQRTRDKKVYVSRHGKFEPQVSDSSSLSIPKGLVKIRMHHCIRLKYEKPKNIIFYAKGSHSNYKNRYK